MTATRTRGPQRTKPLSVDVQPVTGQTWTVQYPSNRNPGKVHTTIATLTTVADDVSGATFCNCPGTAIAGDCWHRKDARVALAGHGATRVDGQAV